jgi:Tol biopolymer transport system component
VGAWTVRAADQPRGKIVYPRKEGAGYRLHVMNADGTNDRELPGQSQPVNVFPSWSADGKRVAFTAMTEPNANQHQIYLIGADGADSTMVNANSQRAGLGGWSPDGKQFAFSAGERRPEVWVGDANGANARRVSPEGAGGFGPFWMRDGERIGYTQIVAGEEKSKLVTVKTDGSGEEPVGPDGGFVVAGPNAVSPDGKLLATLVLNPMPGGDMKMGLHVWSFAEKTDNTVTELALASGAGFAVGFSPPAWSPDGKWLLAASKTDQGTGLFRFSLDGKEKVRLTPEGIDCLAGAWTAHD